MEPQKYGKHWYKLVRSIVVRDIKSDKVPTRLSPGEPIPQEILKSDELRERYVRDGRIAFCAPDGTVLESPHVIKLSQSEIRDMIENPEKLKKALGSKASFSEFSLREMQRLAMAKGLPDEIQEIIQEALVH